MKATKTVVFVLAIVSLLFGISSELWSGGTVAPPPCVVDKLKPQAVELDGTVAVDGLIQVAPNIWEGDAILKLRQFGTQTDRYFRAHFTNASFLTPLDAACSILAANPTDSTGKTIFQAFGFNPQSKNTVLTENSISSSDWANITGTTHNFGIAQITVYIQ